MDKLILRWSPLKLFVYFLAFTLIGAQLVEFSCATIGKGYYSLEDFVECLVTSIIVATVELTLLTALIRRLRVQVAQRQEAEEKLRDANGLLESRVAEQTAEYQSAKAEAERASQAKSRFLAAASHDLRQPFQAMRLIHATLESTVTDPDRVAAGLANLDRAMLAGEALLTSLLDVAQFDAGQLAVELVPVAISDIFRAVAANCAPLAAEKGLRLKTYCPETTVLADRMVLHRIVVNLTTNAIRYTPQGGVLLACRRRRGSVRIEVWDTGIGIAPEQCELIFEEFYQVESSDRERARGVGLGLSIVKRLCGSMGYDLSVRSRVGRGSVFSVGLPLSG